MLYTYPAVFYPENDGRYSVIFPDLNDLATYGDNISDALKMAEEACAQYIFTSVKDGEKLPLPTPTGSVVLDEDNAFVNLILVDFDNFVKQHSNKAVRKTLSIPSWLNTACEAKNINYSKVLQEALINKIQE